MKQIKLTKGLFALVSTRDYGELNKYKWTVCFGSHSGQKPYAKRSYKGKNIKMHRQILKTPKGLVVDHENNNGLDNRRCNIENCTPKENTRRHYARFPRKRKQGRFRNVERKVR